eukprot:3940666-Rhodomonas_salina.1
MLRQPRRLQRRQDLLLHHVHHAVGLDLYQPRVVLQLDVAASQQLLLRHHPQLREQRHVLLRSQRVGRVHSARDVEEPPLHRLLRPLRPVPIPVEDHSPVRVQRLSRHARRVRPALHLVRELLERLRTDRRQHRVHHRHVLR